MKLRDLLEAKDYSGKETNFIPDRFILIGSYSGKKRYDSNANGKKALNKYLDREVKLLQSRIEVSNYGYDIAQSVIAIYIPDYDIDKEEEKAKHKEEKQK
jgi:hypothetical protein